MSDDEGAGAMPVSVDAPAHGAEKQPLPTYGIVRHCDLPESTKMDIIDVVTGTVERYITDIEMAARSIKETLDRLYNPGWHAIVGEAYGFEISYDINHLLYMFFNGNLGILVWKCTV